MFSIKFQRPQIIFTFLLITLTFVAREVEMDRVRPRCERPDYIPNGSYRLRRERVMRITCNSGYQLQGPKTIDCIRGKWDGEKPVCAKKGCLKTIEQPENGRIQVENEVKAILYCSDNYSLAGNRYSYCNGTDWDRPIGNCRVRKNVIQHECDFETDDICGWTYEPRDGLEWKRVMAANVFTTFKTGPRHDHTTLTANGGHYMLMESLSRQMNPVTLTSPIYERDLSLKTACCFQFYYFMYGAGVGDLFVVVKPISLSLDELFKNRTELIKFQKNGNQNNIWNEAHFNIEELPEDFQIIFVAKSGRGHLSDIAVDDVKLLIGEDCKVLDKKEDEDISHEEYDTTTYESLYDIQSCVGRCFEAHGNGLMRTYGHLMGLCNCDPDCEDNDSCCPDYKNVCLNDVFAESSTVYSNANFEESTQENSKQIVLTTTSVKPTISTSTTIPKPSTIISTTLKTTPTTIRTTPSTVRTTLTTVRATPTPTTVKTTLVQITSSTTKTTPTTVKIIPTTVKTTPTTIKTTSTAVTTVKTTRTTPTTTRRTTVTTSRRTPPTTTRRTTIKTSPSTTTTTSTTPRTTATSTTKIIPTFPATKSTANPKVIVPKSAEYIIENNTRTEAAHKGSSLLLYTFIIVVIIIMAGAVYRRFGDSAVAWYMIHFNNKNVGDEETSSITTSFKPPQTNGAAVEQSSKTKSRKKSKKSSFSNDMKSPLVDVDDEDDDDDIGGNGNIALKNNIFTEL